MYKARPRLPPSEGWRLGDGDARWGCAGDDEGDEEGDDDVKGDDVDEKGDDMSDWSEEDWFSAKRSSFRATCLVHRPSSESGSMPMATAAGTSNALATMPIIWDRDTRVFSCCLLDSAR